MISMSELIARRLRPVLGGLDQATAPAEDPAMPTAPPARVTSYGCARLGLERIDEPASPLPPLLPPPASAEAVGVSPGLETPNAPPQAWPLRMPDLMQPSAPPPRPFRRSSFKLPTELHAALRERAKSTGRYQYQLVTEALERYLSLEA